MAYVYKHIRLDKNEVFYIGMGTDKYFFRPKDKKRRNEYWKNITKYTDWIYEVVFINDDLDLVKKKEIELINFYGRKVDGGTLCNMTKGGEGTVGVCPKNIRICFALCPDNKLYKFKSISEAAINTIGIKNISNIVNICKKRNNYCMGWRFSYNETDLLSPIPKKIGKKRKPSIYSVKIWGKSPNGEVFEFENAYRASEYINSHHTLVRKVLKGKSTHTKKWVFSYEPYL